MGLDAVELLMACEEEFEIRIPDEDASKCITPRILSETILNRLKTEGSNACRSQRGFYGVRKALVKIASVNRKELSPNTLLVDLVRGSIPLFWRKLERELSVGSLPRLEFGKRTKYLVYIVIPLVVSISLWFRGFGFSLISLALVVYAIFSTSLGHRYGRSLPSAFKTVKDLIPLVSSLSNKTWSNEEVLNRVMFITAEQSGLNIRKFSPDSHFVDEIGLC